MKMYKWVHSLAILSSIVMLASGCSILGSKEKKQQIDPPPTGAEANAISNAISEVQTVNINMAETGAQMTLYVKDSKGFVAPISLALPKTQSVAKTTLEYMVEEGPSKNLLPSGFNALLPKGTQLSVDIKKEQKLAIVDFSRQFKNYKVEDERKILEAITWTLTSFPSVEHVKLKVDGIELKEMPLGKTPIDEQLNRSLGINIEKPEGVDFGQSTPVTLYFLNQTDNNYKYYVPVTRLVKRTDNVAKAVVEQLIKGPDQKKGLSAVMPDTLDVLGVQKKDGIVTVNFSDKLLGPDKKAPSEALQSVIYSLTENTGVSKVQILVNGDVKVNSTDQQQNYSKPVSRPTSINPLKL